ncbi:MAG: hypothetical protein JXQ90_17575 [Cyclobacteriaceae bacterium]
MNKWIFSSISILPIAFLFVAGRFDWIDNMTFAIILMAYVVVVPFLRFVRARNLFLSEELKWWHFYIPFYTVKYTLRLFTSARS